MTKNWQITTFLPNVEALEQLKPELNPESSITYQCEAFVSIDCMNSRSFARGFTDGNGFCCSLHNYSYVVILLEDSGPSDISSDSSPLDDLSPFVSRYILIYLSPHNKELIFEFYW